MVNGFRILPADAETEKGENRVFVWNNFCTDKEEYDEFPDDDGRSKSPASESSLVGYEIAPGIGSVVPANNEDVTSDSYKFTNSSIDFSNAEGISKKVGKCRGSDGRNFQFRELASHT